MKRFFFIGIGSTPFGKYPYSIAYLSGFEKEILHHTVAHSPIAEDYL